MAAPEWDHLLETLYRRKGADMLLIPGSAPLLRLGKDWRELQTPPLQPEEIQLMAAERLVPRSRVCTATGYAYTDFWHSNVAYFRIMAFGYPETKMILITPRPSEPPPVNRRFTDERES